MALPVEKINKILKNVLIFLAIFLVTNYLLDKFLGEEDLPPDTGPVLLTTTETSYSRNKTVVVEIRNNTENPLTINDECPSEPLDVYKHIGGEWKQVTVSPELDCSETKELIIPPGEKATISYDKWNHALFSDLGRFKIRYETYVTPEFTIEKEGIFSRLWKGLFYRPLYNILIFFVATIPGNSLGLAIILLTILIRTILLIPSKRAMESQKKMQEIQPRLDKVKEKYKGDQQKIAMETMAIWKEANVKPLGSCLPLLLQFPFLIAIFYVVRDGLNPDNAFLLYTQYQNFAFTDINVHFLGLNLTKANLYVLPLVIGGLQFIQMKMTLGKRTPTKDGKNANEFAMAQNMMIYIMPIMIAVFTASLPAGVGIYWGTSTLYGIVQQFFVNKSGPKKDNEPKVRVITTNS